MTYVHKILLALVTILVLVSCDSESQRLQTERAGNTILAALEDYRTDHGSYPLDLQSLSPDYLDALPKAKWGMQDWAYQLLGPDEFQLAVYANPDEYPVLAYSIVDEEWILDQ